MAVAVSDLGNMLFVKNTVGSKYDYLIGITSVPAVSTEKPSKIEVTEQDSAVKQFIKVRGESSDLDFGFNFTKANVAKLTPYLNKVSEFAIVFSEGNGYVITGEIGYERESQETDNAAKGKLTIIPHSIAYKDTFTSTEFNASTIPAGRVKPTGIA